MKFDNKMIVTDLDGTLFDDNCMIPERNLDAISYFKENGGYFTFATGRSHTVIAPEMFKLPNVPIICCNGAYTYDHEIGKKHNEICIAPGPASAIIKIVLTSFPEVGVKVTAGDRYYMITPGKDDPAFKIGYPSQFTSVMTIDEIPQDSWYKAIFTADPEVLSLIAKIIEAQYGDSYQMARAWYNSLEIYNPRSTKGNAALEIKRSLESKAQSPVKLYCIGDYENDLKMLAAADVAACPENAIDSVKAAAAVHVCRNNDGAIAGLVEYIDENL